MNFFFYFFALCAIAKASVVPGPAALIADSALHSNQYHSQDAVGQYSYGYSDPHSAKSEVRSADGQTVGSYSYVDPAGKLQTVHYRSDAVNGFRVAATNLPVAPSSVEIVSQPEAVKDTPEVVEARARHLETLRQTEKAAKLALESASVEVRSAIHAQPAVISHSEPAAVVRSTSAEIVSAAPLIASPSFGYSFGINHGNVYAFRLAQPIFSAFPVGTHLFTSPIVAEPSGLIQQSSVSEQSAPEANPEVIAAKTVDHLVKKE